MKALITFIQGVVFGIANVIPGFSGGTVAYMLGIYEKLLTAIGDFLPNQHKKRKEYFTFLLFLGAGAVVAILGFSGVMQYIMDSPALKLSFYFIIMGAILGSIVTVVLYEKDMKLSLTRLLIFLGTVIGFVLIVSQLNINGNMQPLKVTGSILFFNITEMRLGYYMWLFVIGIIAAGSMILPGFSGSALLLSLGEYHNIIGFISDRMVIPLIFFALGCAVGILVLSKLLSVLLKKFYGGTTYMIIGLMVASVYVLFSEVKGLPMTHLFLNILLMVIGFVVTFMVSSYGKRMKN